MQGAEHQFDLVARRILETDECAYATLIALVATAGVYAETVLLQHRARMVERLVRDNVERDRMIVRIALEVDQRVIALIRAQVDSPTLAANHL